ncbi:MAG TPA: hypothetical protein VF761_06265 [Gemmatimonadaceae bacterium]
MVREDLPPHEPRPLLELPLSARRRLGLSSADPKAQLTGAKAKQSGREFEAEIERANEWYERRGLAVVYRHHPMIEGIAAVRGRIAPQKIVLRTMAGSR